VERNAKLFVLAYQDFDKLVQSDPEFANLMTFIIARRKTKPKNK
jgi:hypothetical protein